jgi:hypothetical protein
VLIRLALALLLPLAPVSSHSASVPITKAEVHAYRLSMPKIRAWYKAMEVSAQRWEPSDDMVKGEETESDDPNVLYEHILKHPKLEAITRDAGLSAREFTVMTYAMVDAAMEAYALKLNPKAKTQSLPANIAVIRGNEAELTQLRVRLEGIEKEKKAKKAAMQSPDDEPAN